MIRTLGGPLVRKEAPSFPHVKRKSLRLDCHHFWFNSSYVSECDGGNGVDDFDVTVFDNDDRAASLAVSDHRPIWATFSD